MGSGYNKTRLFTSIRSETPMFQRGGSLFSAEQGHTCPVRQSEKSAGERSHRSGSSSSERVMLFYLIDITSLSPKRMAA